MKARTAINGHLSSRRLPARFSAASSLLRERRLQQEVAEKAESLQRSTEELRKKAAHWAEIEREAARVNELLTRATQTAVDSPRLAHFPSRFDRHKCLALQELKGAFRLCVDYEPRGLRMPPRSDAAAYIDLLATRFAREVYEHAKATLHLVPA